MLNNKPQKMFAYKLKRKYSTWDKSNNKENQCMKNLHEEEGLYIQMWTSNGKQSVKHGIIR